MGTLTGSAISSTYKSLIFTDKTGTGIGDIYYTLADGNDQKLTTFTSALTFDSASIFKEGLRVGEDGARAILDYNGNESLYITGTDSAVNHFRINNSATGNAVSIDSQGDDTNVNMTIACKGSGTVTVTPLLTATAGIKLGNNEIYASDGGTAITLDTSDNVTIGNNLTVGGKVYGPTDSDMFIHSDGEMSFYIDSDNDESSQAFKFYDRLTEVASLDESGHLQIDGNLTVGGNIIKASDGGSTITMDTSDNVTIGNNLTVTGDLALSDNKDITFVNTNGLDIKDQSAVDYIQFRSGGMTFAASKTLTLAGATTISGSALFTGMAGNTPGTGITAGTTCKNYVERFGDMIKTTIFIDLAGLRANGTNKIIGVDGTSDPCHLGQITAAKNGTIVCGTLKCVEVPAGHSSILDIDLVSSATGTSVEAASVASGTNLIVRGGDWAVDDLKSVANAGTITANHYLYLQSGATATDTEYTTGKFLIELWGTA